MEENGLTKVQHHTTTVKGDKKKDKDEFSCIRLTKSDIAEYETSVHGQGTVNV